jgi:hypothetical protein
LWSLGRLHSVLYVAIQFIFYIYFSEPRSRPSGPGWTLRSSCLLPQPPECWDHRCGHLASSHISSSMSSCATGQFLQPPWGRQTGCRAVPQKPPPQPHSQP